MTPQITLVSEEALRTLVTICVPMFAVTLGAFLSATLQTMIAVREESLQYSVRVLLVAGIVVVFGGSFYIALRQVMEVALR